MKTNNSQLFAPMAKEQMQALTQVTSETVATTAIAQEVVTKFCAADLWNIQKMRRVRMIGRRMFA